MEFSFLFILELIRAFELKFDMELNFSQKNYILLA